MANTLLGSLENEECRIWGHAWTHYIPAGRRTPSWGREFFLRCGRCGANRIDRIDTLGNLSSRRYEYPDGYLIKNRDDMPTREALRLDILQNLYQTPRRRRRGA